MKTLLIPVLILSFLVVPTAYAHIADVNVNASIRANNAGVRATTSVKASAERQEKIRTQFETRKKALLENHKELKVRLQAEAKVRVENLVDRIVGHLQNALDRFERAHEKIEARIEAFEERGLDMSESAELLAEAEAKADNSATVLAEAKVSLEAELAKSEVSRDAIKAIVDEVRESLRETHAAYVEVIASIRASVEGNASLSGSLD